MRTKASKVKTFATIASEITNVAGSDAEKKEKAQFAARIAAWMKKENKKAKGVIALLPSAIKRVAKKGGSQLIVRVEITQPYLHSDIGCVYDVLSRLGYTVHDPKDPPAVWAQLASSECSNLRESARQIALWALNNGFKIKFGKWSCYVGESFVREKIDILNVDKVVTRFFKSRSADDDPVCEGFMITW